MDRTADRIGVVHPFKKSLMVKNRTVIIQFLMDDILLLSYFCI